MTLKVDHHVVSADGTRYRVRYVHVAHGMVDLNPVDSVGDCDFNEEITLPIAELRRVAASKRIPVEGLVAIEERPKCGYCARALKHITQDVYERMRDGRMKLTRKVFKQWYGYGWNYAEDRPNFCTAKCSIWFANEAYRAGYRVKKRA